MLKAYQLMKVDWDSPYSFFSKTYAVKNESGDAERTIAGSVGAFLGIWYANIDPYAFHC